MNELATEKVCNECWEPRLLGEFSVLSKTKDGLSYACRQCQARKRREQRADAFNPLTVQNQKRVKRAASKRLAYNHPIRVAQRRARKLRDIERKYGVTKEWYFATLAAQDNKCPICGDAFDDDNRACVDHSHETGDVRALLCGTCNTSLGGFHDNPDLLRAAIAYLERHAK